MLISILFCKFLRTLFSGFVFPSFSSISRNIWNVQWTHQPDNRRTESVSGKRKEPKVKNDSEGLKSIWWVIPAFVCYRCYFLADEDFMWSVCKLECVFTSNSDSCVQPVMLTLLGLQDFHHEVASVSPKEEIIGIDTNSGTNTHTDTFGSKSYPAFPSTDTSYTAGFIPPGGG